MKLTLIAVVKDVRDVLIQKFAMLHLIVLVVSARLTSVKVHFACNEM
jgi:hypothetical protein